MQQYAITGEWDREPGRTRLLEWSQDNTDEITGWFEVKGGRIRMYSSDANGAPDERFAAGRISQKQLFNSLDEGLWGSNPCAGAVVDVWGDGINKLATLAVTNFAVYDNLFGT